MNYPMTNFFDKANKPRKEKIIVEDKELYAQVKLWWTDEELFYEALEDACEGGLIFSPKPGY